MDLIEQDKQRKFKQLENDAIANNLSQDELFNQQSEANKKCDNYINELNDMFAQLDTRRKVCSSLILVSNDSLLIKFFFLFSH